MSRTVFGVGLGTLAVAGVALAMSSSAFATDKDFDCGSGDGDGRKFLRVLGLSDDGALVCFNELAPRASRTIGYVSGLSGDTKLIGIDFRVQDGFLYGVGDAGGVYTLNTSNATATLVNRLTEVLRGTSFGVDFNPAADRLRIVSDVGQNLRHNVNGTTAPPDGDLNYVAGTPALGITGAAYTNNDLDALTGTTLFDLDTSLDQIAIQSPPNNGSLVATGKLPLDVGAVAGFDIYSSLRNGVTKDNRSFAVLNVGGETSFYRVDLLTGEADFAGKLRETLVDIAVPLNQ